MDGFGSLLRKKRRNNGLKLEDVARQVTKGSRVFDPSLLSRWERGERQPEVDDREIVLQLGDILDMSLEERNQLLLSAGLAPLQPEDLDIDKMLQGWKRWEKTRYLHEVMKWEEVEIGEKLGIPFWEVRADLEKAERERHSEKVVLEPFAQRWLRAVQVLSPAELMRRELENLSREAVHRQVTTEETRRFYYQSALLHLPCAEGARVVAGSLENESLYYQLRRQFPKSATWPAYHSWGEQYVAYLRAFSWWSSGINSSVMLLRQEFQEAIDDTNLPKLLQLMSLCLGCDLLAQGIQESPPDVRWSSLLMRLLELRADACVLFSSLKGESQPRDWSTGANTIWADPEDCAGLVKDTKTLLDELHKLWLVQDQLVAAFQELEAKALSTGP